MFEDEDNKMIDKYKYIERTPVWKIFNNVKLIKK